ncbi:hypothetical protein BRADI_1g17503v3 [Brachypodium distachyon]|uniref:Uncharacterized protein n=1 Tax=Brachypodium distachyon TaxID=15368 RepID=A0A2K2DJU4_BRADI|nr:hypothetical protein BRADI_1g17503v3 [Brachypodium distachyon]
MTDKSNCRQEIELMFGIRKRKGGQQVSAVKSFRRGSR